jgi:hypothetical protein
MWKRIKARTLDFRKDEGGQSFVFAAFTMFLIVIFSLMILGIGEAGSIQIRLQNAADSAAYSGAQVQADCVAQIAWTNEAMAQVYYYTVRRCVDTATYAVYAEIADPTYLDWTPESTDGIKPDDGVVGISGAVGKWKNAYDEAVEWVPRGELWMRRLSQLERGIASIAPALVEHQIFHTAENNGAERTCFYPGFSFLPDGPNKRDVDIAKLEDPDGWHVWSDTDQFDLSAVHTTKIEPEDEGWEQAEWHDVWDISSLELEALSQISIKARFEEKGETRPATYRFTVVKTAEGDVEVEEPETEERTVFVDKNGKCLIQGEGDMADISLTVTPDGKSIIDMEYPDGKNTSMSYDKDGFLCQWNDADQDGVQDPDEWDRVSDKTSANINGVEVPFNFNPVIEIDTDVSVKLTDPIHIYLGKLHVTLTEPLKVSYSTHCGQIYLEDDFATINGLSTKHADSKWKRWDTDRQQQNNDRTRHRMLEEYEAKWKYEWVRVGSYMTEMTFKKLGLHGIMDDDSFYASSDTAYAMPDSTADEEWKTSATGEWANFPKWAQPPRDPADIADPEFGGWFDLAAGAPHQGESGPAHGTCFSQTRECWYCGDKGDVAGPLVDLNYTHTGTFLKKCVRPCGFWHELLGTDLAAENAWNARKAYYGSRGANFSALDKDDVNNPYKSYMLQVNCPFGCKNVFEHAPKRYCAEGEEHNTPTRIRRYLYHAFGRHGKVPVPPQAISRQMDMGYDEEAHPDYRDFFALKLPSSGDHAVRKPLELTSEIFRNSINVMTYAKSNEQDLTGSVKGKEGNTPQDQWQWNPLESPNWGHFALSSARLFLAVGESTMPGVHKVSIDPGMAYGEDGFVWDSGVPIEGEDDLDPIGRQMNWNRERWLRNGYNLFEPAWGAGISPLRLAVNPLDYYTQEELDDGGVEDNGVALMMRLLRTSYWRKSVVDSGYGWHNTDNRTEGPVQGWDNIKAPPMQGGNVNSSINWESDGIENVVRH